MTTNTPTPDVAATREAANKYAAVFLRWERVPHGKGVKAELDAAEAAVEAAVRDACVTYALAVLTHVEDVWGDLLCACGGGPVLCRWHAELQALREAR